MQYFGQIGRLRREKIAEYCELHANPWPDVLKTISDCHLRNYSIFLHDDLVFAYFEYAGSDFDSDMALMAEDSVTQDWWTHTKPCFETYAFGDKSEFYHDMKRIFYHA